MRASNGLWPLLLATCLTACASEPIVSKPVAQPQPTVSPEPAPTGESVDLTPIDRPTSLMLVLRAPKLQQSFEFVQRVVKLPAKLEALLSDATRGASAYFDLGQPFDLAVSFDAEKTRDLDEPRFMVAFSIPLQAGNYQGLLDTVERGGDEVRQVGPGYYRIRSRGMVCELVAPEAVVPRLVCGDSAAAFKELGGWMYRSLAKEAAPKTDVGVQISFGPMRDKLVPLMKRKFDTKVGEAQSALQRLQVKDPDFTTAPATIARELTSFVEDFDGFNGSLTFDSTNASAVASGEVSFRDSKSWLTRVLASSMQGPAGPAPEAFWRLPKDADFAFFGHAPDPNLFAGPVAVLKKAATVAVDLVVGEKKDRDALLGLLDVVPEIKGAWTFAAGPVAPLPGGPAKPEDFKPADTIRAARNALRGMVGWGAFSAEGDATKIAELFKRGSAGYALHLANKRKSADADIAAQRKHPSPHTDLRILEERRKRLDRDQPTAKFVGSVPGLPKGSAAVDISLPVNSRSLWSDLHPLAGSARPPHPAAEVKGSLDVRLIVAPDEAGRFIVAWGVDADDLKQRVVTMLKGSAESRLGARSDLARLKGAMRGGGFATPGRLVAAAPAFDVNDRELVSLKQFVDQQPSHLLAPIFFTQTGQGGPKPTIGMSIILDKPGIEDLGATFMLFLSSARAETKPATSTAMPERPRR